MKHACGGNIQLSGNYMQKKVSSAAPTACDATVSTAAGFKPEYRTCRGPSKVCSSFLGLLSSSWRSSAVSLRPTLLSCILIALRVLCVTEARSNMHMLIVSIRELQQLEGLISTLRKALPQISKQSTYYAVFRGYVAHSATKDPMPPANASTPGLLMVSFTVAGDLLPC